MKTFCYHCGNVHEVSESEQGTEKTCPTCGKTFTVETYDEIQMAEQGQSPPEPRPRIALAPSTIALVCNILCAFVLFLCICVFVTGFVMLWSRFFVGLVTLANAVVLFSISWALYAVSEIIKQISADSDRPQEVQ